MRPLRLPRVSGAPRAILSLAIGCSALVAAAAAARPLDVPEPALPAPAGPPPVEPSFVRLPLWVSLRPMLVRIEQAVPSRFGTSNRFEHDDEGLDLRYDVQRGPFTLTARHDTLLIRAPVSYRAAAKAPKLAPVSCGDSARITGRIGCLTRVGWGDGWHVDARSLPLPDTYDRHCGPEVEGFDVSELMDGKIAPRMVEPLPNLVTSGIREGTRAPTTIEAAWRALETPLPLGNDRWLDFGARRMLAEPLTVVGDSAYAELAIEVEPRITATPPGSGVAALPETRVRLFGDEFIVPLDYEVPLDSLAGSLRRSLEDPPIAGGAFRLRGVRLRGGGDQLIVTLELEGAIDGRLHLQGRPEFDGRTNVLAARNLDWTRETSAALRSLGSNPASAPRRELDELRRRVREALRVDLTHDVVTNVASLGRQLNRPLTETASISGGIHQRRVVGVYVTAGAVGVRIAAAGRARLTVQ